MKSKERIIIKRVTIIKPAYLDILRTLKKEKFYSTCANKYCQAIFFFKGSFVIKAMIPHIKKCKKRKEKRGSYAWIDHYCEKCEKKFVWDVPIHIRIKGQEVTYRYKLETKKYLAPFPAKYWKQKTTPLGRGIINV